MRIGYAAVVAALAGAVASWVALGVYAIASDLLQGRLPVVDAADWARTLAALVVIGVPASLPLTATAAVIAHLIRRRGLAEATPGPERYPMRTRFLLGCAAAGAIWEAGAWTLMDGDLRAKLVGLGGAFGLVAGVAGGWVLWRWSRGAAGHVPSAIPTEPPHSRR